MDGRQTKYRVAFDGADITEDIRPYFLSLDYKDSEDGAADDFQLKLQDRDGLWLGHWLNEAVEAAAGARLKLACAITKTGWGESDGTLESGSLELDSVAAKGPPSVVTVKGTGLGFSSAIRQVRRSKAWENLALSAIAAQIAQTGGTACLFEAAADPWYSRAEQDNESDVAFLERLCEDAGLALKCTDGKLVLFSKAEYEGQEPYAVFVKGEGYYLAQAPTVKAGGYLSYTVKSGTADTRYDACRVSYWDSAAGRLFQGTAYAEDYDAEDEDNRLLEVTARVSSDGEAAALAAQRLKLCNEFARSATVTVPGDTRLMAGRTVKLSGWGGWDGKYMIAEADHSVSADGYTTQLSLRKVPDAAETGGDAAGAGTTYTVKRGDNLWKIAKAYYGSGALWPKIYAANRAVIGSDPNLIYPGQVFVIP